MRYFKCVLLVCSNERNQLDDITDTTAVQFPVQSIGWQQRSSFRPLSTRETTEEGGALSWQPR